MDTPKAYAIYWSPEGRKLDIVHAVSAKAAIRKAPQPYRKHPGELYALEVETCAVCGKDLPIVYPEYGTCLVCGKVSR